ncbi:MAG TPA: alpha/beta hydrolase [Jatrophihabitantaceae bacterium]|nr:alpha/beta hydrolase [Jatrophihabitantaceae bacterium]
MGRIAELGWRATGRVVSVPPAVDVPDGRVVELPGRGSTYVVDTGPADDGSDRPTLFLLHALACTAVLTWYPAIDALRRSYRIVAFDQRWHGKGIRSPQFRLEDCADDAVALADALGVDRFVAVGYSMGSLVAQLVARQHPDRVAGAVLCATTSRFTPPDKESAALRLVSAGLSAAATRRFKVAGAAAEVTVPTIEHNKWALAQLRTTTAAAITGAAAVISRFDSSAWVGELTLPTSLVVTAHDRLIPSARQKWVAQQIQDSAVYEIDAGHSSCVMNAKVFTPALQAACASVSARVSVPSVPALR